MSLLSACAPAPPASPSPAPGSPTQPPVVISQVMAGAAGDNNHEFVELYNSASSDVDLAGWRLTYRLPSSSADLPFYAWDQAAWIPAHGHYLLAREDEDVGAPPDAVFSQPLNLTSGGLALWDPEDDLADSLAWGERPATMGEGPAAPALRNGASLVRVQDPRSGEPQDTQANSADFEVTDTPQPRDSGTRAAFGPPPPFTFAVVAPASLSPGEAFALNLVIVNTSHQPVPSVTASLHLPDQVTTSSLPEGVSVQASELEWAAGMLAAGQSARIEINLRAPWGQSHLAFSNARAVAEGLSRTAFAVPVWVSTRPGPIPVRVARSLLNQEVIVEGVATITAGSLFAGAGNTKFYMSDSTGGVQIWVPGGGNGLSVPQDARVRVRGTPQLYRGTVELVAASPDSVEVIQANNSAVPLASSIQQINDDPSSLAGQLVSVEGQLVRSTEETYSYNMTLATDQGQTLDVYLDKQTLMTNEGLTADQPYQVMGILETPNSIPTLYPRLPSDFLRLYPPTLSLTLDVPATVDPHAAFQILATLANHTSSDLHGVTVETTLPGGLAGISPGNGGGMEGNRITWLINSLQAGDQAVVSYEASTGLSKGQVTIPEFTADVMDLHATSEPQRVFVGELVPVWAIQGAGSHSPYVLQTLSTAGIVTGVMPGLSGFWIQAEVPDGDLATSDGIFINTTGMRVAAVAGDVASIRGEVREISDQTQLLPAGAGNIEITSQGHRLPAPVPLDPPADDQAALAYLEAREGMLVTPAGPAVAVGPTSRYGEYTLVLADHGTQRLMLGSPAGWRITVDDGADTVHDVDTRLPYVVGVGDIVNGLVGPLAYTFGQHKIEPIAPPRVTPARPDLPQLEPAPVGAFRVMTWNAENLFDPLPPHPSDPPPPTPDQYRRNLDKVAATILVAGAPTVVALQEVENIDILSDLAALDQLAPYHYAPYLIEGTDSRGIDVGYLVRPDRAQIIHVEQIPAPQDLMSRPPLELDLQLIGVPGLDRVTLLNNHFLALSGGVELTRPIRLAQAGINAQVVAARLGDDPQAAIAVLGDLNSFYASPPVQSLIESGLTDLFDELRPDQRYDYIYQGVAQTLDHILVSDRLFNCLADFQVLHLDSPFPPPPADDVSPLHKSDHDPLVATFRCSP